MGQSGIFTCFHHVLGSSKSSSNICKLSSKAEQYKYTGSGRICRLLNTSTELWDTFICSASSQKATIPPVIYHTTPLYTVYIYTVHISHNETFSFLQTVLAVKFLFTFVSSKSPFGFHETIGFAGTLAMLVMCFWFQILAIPIWCGYTIHVKGT